MMTPPADAVRLVFRTRPQEIAYLHAVVEGYDDLALLRTIDAAAGLIEVFLSPGAEDEFGRLAEALRLEGVPLEALSGEEGPCCA